MPPEDYRNCTCNYVTSTTGDRTITSTIEVECSYCRLHRPRWSEDQTEPIAQREDPEPNTNVKPENVLSRVPMSHRVKQRHLTGHRRIYRASARPHVRY